MKSFLGIALTDSSQNISLGSLIVYVSGVIETYTSRKLSRHTYTEYYSGEGTSVLLLRQYPVLNVVDVWLDSNGFFGQGVDGLGNNTAFAVNTKLKKGQDYALRLDDEGVSNAGMLLRLTSTFAFGRSSLTQPLSRSAWPGGQGNLKIVYEAGYDPIPPDLELACNLGIAHVKNTARLGGFVVGSETLREKSYSLMLNPNRMPTDMTEILKKYKRVRL